MATAIRPDAPAWGAQPKQETFLTDFAHVFEVLYGGAAGGGKSDSLLMFSILRRMKYPRTAGLFLRRQAVDLEHEGGAIPRSHDLLNGRPGMHWNGQKRKWTFPNGSVLEFGHMKEEEDKRNYQSSAYADICFDELTHFTESQYLYMFSRARTTVVGCSPKIRSGSNPGSIGHGWVKTRFVDCQPPERAGWFIRVNDRDQHADPNNPRARSRAFVPSRVYDNAILMNANPDYVANLEAMSEDDRKALLEGDWDAWYGNVFKQWSRDRHTLRPFAIPPRWTVRVGMDWGVARPFVALWGAWGSRLPDDGEALHPCDQEHVYVYREVAERGLRDEDMARYVATYSQGEPLVEVRADPASFFLTMQQTGYSPGAVFMGEPYRLPLIRANNDRLKGKRKVDEMLGQCACGVPRLRVFDTCVELIRTLPSLPYDAHTIEDVDTDAEDDAYDALRYLLMGPREDPYQGQTVNLKGPQWKGRR